MKNAGKIASVVVSLAVLGLCGMALYSVIGKDGGGGLDVPISPPIRNQYADAPPLAQRARELRSDNPAVRKAAVAAVEGEAGTLYGLRQVGPACLPDLLVTLRSADTDVRDASALLLGRIGHDALAPLLEELRRLDRERTASYLSCVLPPTPGQCVFVSAWAGTQRRIESILAVSLALSTIAVRQSEHPLDDLRPGLRDPSPAVRCGCATALGLLAVRNKDKVVPAVPDLVPLLRDPDDEVSAGAAAALARLSPGGTKVLGEALTDGPPSLRRNVAQALALVGPTTKEMAVQPRNAVQQLETEQALLKERRRAKAPAHAALLKALADEQDEVRLAAAQALVDFREDRKTVEPVLAELAKHKNKSIAREARRAQQEMNLSSATDEDANP